MDTNLFPGAVHVVSSTMYFDILRMNSQIDPFFFNDLTYLVPCLRNPSLPQCHKDITLHFLLKILKVVHFTLKSLIHLEFAFA